MIPKKGQPDKWSLIMDLFSLQGHSVNDGINPEFWHLQYIKMDDIIKMASKFGPGALMAKFDIESAYRNIAIHPSDSHLLGLKWRNAYYIDLALPFMLRAAPAIFNSVAELVEWILVHNYTVQPANVVLKRFSILIGRLHHTCIVVWPGRTFLCRMIDLLSCFRNDSHPIRLNVEFGKDMARWVELFGQWNGISFFPPLSLCMAFPSVLMHLVLLVMVLLWTTNGSMVYSPTSTVHCLHGAFSCSFSSPCLVSWLIP